MNKLVQENWKWLIGVVFTAGFLYAGIEDVKTRQTKKIKIQNELIDRVHKLEIDNAILKTKLKCNE